MEKDYSLKAMVKDFTGEIIHVDSKSWRSVKALFVQPGRLTMKYFSGERESYAKPFKLYLIANLIFFLAGPMFGLFTQKLDSLKGINPGMEAMVDQEVENSGLSYEVYEERFNAHISYKQPTYIFLLVPFFALGMKLLYFRRYYLEHLVFAMHFFAFFLFSAVLYFGVTISLFKWISSLGIFAGQPFSEHLFTTMFITLVYLFLGSSAVYLAAALKKVYGTGIVRAVVSSLLLWGWLGLLLSGYTFFIFYNTVYSLRYFS